MDLRERQGSSVRHPWEVARAAFFVDVLADHGIKPKDVLDVGAGDAYFADRLRRRFPTASLSLVDANYSAADVDDLTARGFLASTSQPAGPFDVVTVLDVAEHVDDAPAFMNNVLASASPGAHVLFSVPAWQGLWSAHDVALDHRRRYAPKDARRLLEDAGLTIVECGGVFHSLLLPRALEVLRERLAPAANDDGADAQHGGADHGAQHGVGGWSRGALASSLVASVLRAEQRVSRALSKRGVDAPGLTWWALARR